MTINLVIFSLAICLCFTIILIEMIKRKKILLKYALLWLTFDILIILSVLLPGLLRFLCNILGIEVISNMLFFFGFILLTGICLALTSIISNQKLKITTLSQELAILEKKVNEIDKENKKTTK